MTELTAEMVVDGLQPSDLRLAPDGQMVAYVVAPIGQRDEHRTSAIWVAATTDGTPPRRISAGTAEDRGPRWSPDGASLYFLSDRLERGKPQLHRLPLEGGESEALTDWKPGLVDVVPLVDERTIALLAMDLPTEEDERRERERDDAEVFGERWQLQRLRLLDIDTRVLRTIDALGDRHVVEVAPSPDGASLAVLTWPTPEQDQGLRHTEVHVVDPVSGEARLVCVLAAGGHTLVWGQESDRLYLLAHRKPDWQGGLGVFAVPLPSGPPRLVTGEPEACPVDISGCPGAHPLVTIADGLDTAIDRLDPASEQLVRLAHHRGYAGELTTSKDGRTIALLRSTAGKAVDVWAGPPDGPIVQLTKLRSELRGVTWGCQERLTWTAPDGSVIDGLLIVPPGASTEDGSLPLVTLVHGGPYSRYADDFQLGWYPSGQWLALAGYAVFLPNPRGGMGHGDAFADRVAGAVGMADWQDILAGIDMLIERGVADRSRLGIGGWSQGGFMTAWAIGQTRRFKAGVMLAGVSDWGMMVAESDLAHFEAMLGGSTGWEGPGPHRHDALSPISFVRQVETPVLILHGADDPRVPVSQARFFARGLREHGVPHTLVVYPRETHAFRERNHQLDVLRRTRAWFDQWLRSDAVTGDPASNAEPSESS